METYTLFFSRSAMAFESSALKWCGRPPLLQTREGGGGGGGGGGSRFIVGEESGSQCQCGDVVFGTRVCVEWHSTRKYKSKITMVGRGILGF